MADQVESTHRAVEYIESNLHNDISVGQVADEVGYSLFHFIRTFNRLVHHTPYDYLMRRRLSEAANVLTISQQRIIDIAQDFCFESQESFSRAFKKMFYLQPSQWREQKPDGIWQLMPAKTNEDLVYLNGRDFHPPIIENLEEKTFYGLMSILEEKDKPGQKERLKQDFFHIRPTQGLIEIVETTLFVDNKNKREYFFIGINEDIYPTLNPLLAAWRLPAGKYIKIEINDQIRRQAMNYLLFTWLPQAGFRPAGSFTMEIFHPNLETVERIFLYLPIESIKNQ